MSSCVELEFQQFLNEVGIFIDSALTMGMSRILLHVTNAKKQNKLTLYVIVTVYFTQFYAMNANLFVPGFSSINSKRQNFFCYHPNFK